MYGQEIHAAIVLKGDKKVSEKELAEYVAEKAAKFKVPKKVLSTTLSELMVVLFYEGDSEDCYGEGPES